MSNDPGPIPDRWLQCPRKATDLLDGKFLAFKTPLDSKFDDQVPMEHRFTPALLFSSLKSRKIHLGLWIDLTNTSRYYSKSDVEAENCAYVKLECKGHGGAPTKEQTRSFVELCRNFISRHPLHAIGVHCTHGFNRTGFLLAAYLVEGMDWSLEAAIMEFSKIRPPGIYKEDYIKELYRRYESENNLNFVRAPPLPDWCYTSTNGTSSQPASSKSHRKGRTSFRADASFMEGIPGVTHVTDLNLVNAIQCKLKELANSKSNSFPGSQPVSMDRTNITYLRDNPYRVSWKADGTRYMMLIIESDEIYFSDRDNSIFKVTGDLKFFNRKCNSRHLTDTLLDGEMVLDKVGSLCIPRYLVYDIICFEGNRIGDAQFYPTRLQAIDVEIIQPRIIAMKEGRIFKDNEPFSIRAKAFYDISYTSYLLSEKFARQLTHDPDGLIFQPSNDAYKCGKTTEVLKWKPPSMNSVDFYLEVKREDRVGYANQFVGNLYVGNKEKFGEIKCSKAVKALNNKIIECKYENGQWVLMRERTDKSFPNAFETAISVFNSIRNPVTKEDLLDFIEHHRYKELMPPPQQPPIKRMRTNN